MKKLLLILLELLGFIVFFLIGIIAISLLEDFVAELPLMIALICVYIWLTRDDKDGFYSIFKATHQFNKEQVENNEDQETYLFDTSRLLYYPKKLIQLIKH